MGDGVAVINSGEETASEVSALLDYHNLLDATDEEIEHRFSLRARHKFSKILQKTG